MQSTPSRARHSASILAPLINVDIFFFASEKLLDNKKAISRVASPRRWPWKLVPAGLQAGPVTMTRMLIMMPTDILVGWERLVRAARVVSPLSIRGVGN